MQMHLKNLNIKSFRGIRELLLEDLSSINILTGDNNSGKTSVLEVIESLEAPADINMWMKLGRSERNAVRGLSLYDGLINLFSLDDDSPIICYKAQFLSEEIAEIELHLKREIANLSLSQYERLSGISFLYDGDGDQPKLYSRPEVEINEAERLIISFFLNGKKAAENELYDIDNHISIRKPRSKPGSPDITYISPTRHVEGILYLNSVLDNPELYEQMLEILKEFDPGIISINVDNANERTRRGNVYKILSKEHDSALPLNVYGDGMKKAVLLMSAVVKSKGGILLLDEFETAIHTTAMQRVFSWILTACIKLDVQLFLTTHSEEALDKVLKCCPELQDKIKVYTLYNNKDKTVVRSLIAEKAIEAKDEMGLELR